MEMLRLTSLYQQNGFLDIYESCAIKIAKYHGSKKATPNLQHLVLKMDQLDAKNPAFLFGRPFL